MRHDVIVIIRQVVMTEITAVIATHGTTVEVGVPVEIQSRKRGDDNIVRAPTDVVIVRLGLEVEVDHHRRTAVVIVRNRRNIINTTVVVMNERRNDIENDITIIVVGMMITLSTTKMKGNAKQNTIAVKDDEDKSIRYLGVNTTF